MPDLFFNDMAARLKAVNERTVRDLEAIKEDFEEKNDGCYPASLDKAIEAVKGAKPKGEWIYAEFSHKFDGGGSILMRGYNCPFCGNFINRKSGKKNFCDECGADLRGEVGI